MSLHELSARLREIEPDVRLDEMMSRHTTFGIGGPADIYIVAKSVETLALAARLATEAGQPFFVLGSGSNVLVGDRGIRGVVIENAAKRVEEPRPLGDGAYEVVGESGASFAAVARRLSRAGKAGLDWAIGIPGTLGGGVVYNAGAYGGSLVDVLRWIDVSDPSDGVTRMAAEELNLVYRGSAFTRGLLAGRVILRVGFTVYDGDADALKERIGELDRRRIGAQPRGRNAGSVFKNPEGGQPAWRLIDAVGLRGHRIGDAQISELHANFFVNAGHARAAEVRALIELARARVQEQFGIHLDNEVAIVGEGFELERAA